MIKRSTIFGALYLFKRIPLKAKRQGILVLIISITTGITEAITIGSIVPLISALSSSGTNKFIRQDAFAGYAEHLTKPANGFILFAILFLCTGLLRIALINSKQYFVRLCGVSLSEQCYNSLLHQPYEFHTLHGTNESVCLISHKISLVVNQVLLSTITIILSSVICLIVFLFLCHIDPIVATLMVSMILTVYFLIGYFYRELLVSLGQQSSYNRTKRIQIVQESLGNIRDIILSRLQLFYVMRFTANEKSLLAYQSKYNSLLETKRVVIEITAVLVMISLSYYLSNIRLDNQFALEILGMYALAAQRLLPLFHQTYTSWGNLQHAQSAMLDVLQCLRYSIPDKTYLKTCTLKKSILLDRFRFHYPGITKLIFNDLSIEIFKGQRVAIIGESGAGKTTLIDLISGLLKPQYGKFIVDGEALGEKEVSQWRDKIAYVPQLIFLANKTIAENIAIGQQPEEVDQELLDSATRSAGIYEYIQSLSAGYQSLCGENGIFLSGGQRQRIGIARALYSQKPILILDEPTSALDHQSESQLIDTLLKLSSDLTLIIVTHRDSLAKLCDRVLTIKGRRVFESMDSIH